MPQQRYLTLNINNKNVDLPSQDEDLGFRINYTLEEPDSFMSKQGAEPQNITIPSSKNNDQIFNTFHNPQVEDLSPNGEIISATIFDGGLGFIIGDIVILLAGNSNARIQVDSVDGSGRLLTFHFVSNGTNYSEGTTCETSGGFGCYITITSVSETSFRELMPCCISVNGSVPILSGYALLQDASLTDKPEEYDITLYGANGLWVIDMQNITMWDCVNSNNHTFDVPTIEASWANFNTAGDGSDDYVYAPVRYRQPFDGTTLGFQGDNCVNIYHLRPSISLYWLIVRAFKQIGFSISSQFFATEYFQRIVLPWVWGDFYDIDSQLVEGVCFQAAGEVTKEPPPLSASIIPFWSGTTSGSTIGSANGSSWWHTNVIGGWNPGGYSGGLATLANGINALGGVYVFSGNGTSPSGFDWFKMDISNPPDGYDNFNLYSFDESTGTMIYSFNPPPSLQSFTNVSITFLINLYVVIANFVSSQCVLCLECTHIPASGPTIVTCQSIMPSGGALVGFTNYPTGNGYPTTPIACNVVIPNVNPGDVLKFRIRLIQSGPNAAHFGIFSGGLLNNNPSVLGVPSYTYNPVTQQFNLITPNSIWSPLFSKMTMTGFLIQIGNQVNLKNYDAFRSVNVLDLLSGIVDAFNLEVQTDNINKVITIEPMFGSVLPTSEVIDGYFLTNKIFDWTPKQDVSKSKGSKMNLFNGSNRQIDLTFKLDSSDGSQTIWAQRYKGIYLNNRTYTGSIYQNNINIDNGIIAGIPGCARYMLPNRFAKGNLQIQNRFFSVAMQTTFPCWKDLTIYGIIPQMLTIFTEDTSAESAISQSFTPKLAYYKGYFPAHPEWYGAFIWIGDPALPNISPIHSVPYMFSVNYGYNGASDPVLSYSDENIGGVQVKGLMSQFYLQRFAIMRNGQLYTTNIRLNLNDICNWEHQETIMINGTLYALIQIEGYNPLSDDSTPCTMWKIVNPTQVDLDNSFPSSLSILQQPKILPSSYDLRYAPLLIYPTDLPQIS